VPVSTMTNADGLAELVRDSRARLLAVSGEFAGLAREAIVGAPDLAGVLGPDDAGEAPGGLPWHGLGTLLSSVQPDESVYPTTADSPAFWLYTSGTTGSPKGAMHRHGSIQVVRETYGAQVLRIMPEDRCLSAAKAFFAYGLGNSVLFPLSAGAAAVLEPARSQPAIIADRAREYGATLFFAGPTFFANMLRADLPRGCAGRGAACGVRRRGTSGRTVHAMDNALRRGDPRRHRHDRNAAHFPVQPGRPGAPGHDGLAVPGYDLKIVDDDGLEVPVGKPGTLLLRGESAATGYWARYHASRLVFQGEWLRTGDTYVLDADGYYTCLGRTGDMLKASGMWVAPAEVEARLHAHQAVADAVVVAAMDADGLEKPVAFVILRPGQFATETELIQFCREGLPSYKRPRRIVFVSEYPITHTGKIRRVELRQTANDTGLLAKPSG
jgi:acyl-coenzyme A synthetase/AMP-(fatty) acid ligase